MLKPGFPFFSMHVRRWIKEALNNGESFDIAHQLMPQAVRYGTPLRHFDIPFVMGPLGGALKTPTKFQEEVGSAPLFTRLRELDSWRLRHDPWLKAGLRKAKLVLGVAPYMKEVLNPVGLQRFEAMLELGIDDLPTEAKRHTDVGRLRLLHVGRAVRTKGLRDVVRSLKHLEDMPGITLTSAGSGEEIAICKAEAEALGVASRVTFLGRTPRDEVERLYETHDVFVFPSFREPAGGVLYEAMRWGLPVITARRGGPEWIVDETSGVRIPVTDPVSYARDIAEAIRRFAVNPDLRQQLGSGARAIVDTTGRWPNKAAAMVALYESILS
jgi:glycosyltransferase involved in cell wall biosynthesis